MLRAIVRRRTAVAAAVAGLVLFLSGVQYAGPPADETYGTVRGRVILGGTKLPEKVQLKVDKDTDQCLAHGTKYSERWVVNESNRGLKNVVAFFKAPKGKKFPIPDALKEPASKEVALDQPSCAFSPHVLALRAGQVVVAKNPDKVPHNVVVNGIRNTANVQIPVGSTYRFELFAESGPIKVTCGAHPWMEGYVWVFEHPYFAVTDANGNFEIKNVPAGAQSFILWHEVANFVPNAKGRTVEVKAGAETDVGVVEVPLNP